MKLKTQKNIEKSEEGGTEFLNEKNEIITIVVSEENMNLIVSHNLNSAGIKPENKPIATKVGNSPKTVMLSFDFGDTGNSYQIVFTGSRDKITIGDFYNLLDENLRLNQTAAVRPV